MSVAVGWEAVVVAAAAEAQVPPSEELLFEWGVVCKALQ